MMTFAETLIFDSMINVIENLEHPKSISDIINDLNELILTLNVRNNDIIDEAETVTPEHIKTETNMIAETVTPEQIKTETKTKAETVTSEQIKTETKTKAETVTPVQIKTDTKIMTDDFNIAGRIPFKEWPAPVEKKIGPWRRKSVS